MQPSEFLNLLQHPKSLNGGHTSEIAALIKEFPYLQSARALYLKALKNSESATYNHQLKITAAYTTDRSILFDFIVSDEFNQNEISETIKRNTEHLKDIEVHEAEDISVDKSVEIDDALKKQISETEGVLDPDLFEEKVEVSKVAKLSDRAEREKVRPIKMFSSYAQKSPEELLQIGKPLEFNKTETHSFNEWLKIATLKPIDRSSTNNKGETQKKETISKSKEQKFNLIDRFIKNNPKITPTKEYAPKPILYRDEINHEGLMTETLARIYLEQNNYEKAIQAYKILSLKYPEKSSFFADQIKAVEELQEQNKSK